MTPPPPNEVTQLLREWSQGDQAAPEKLMPLVYAELHRMARRYMAGQNRGHTLQTTALIHEAYLRLVNQSEKQWQNRSHFFAVAAQAMRHILVDYALKTGRETWRRGASSLARRGSDRFAGTRRGDGRARRRARRAGQIRSAQKPGR
jgi:RNA polymerase sigma factor (TIGR02999 family)